MAKHFEKSKFDNQIVKPNNILTGIPKTACFSSHITVTSNTVRSIIERIRCKQMIDCGWSYNRIKKELSISNKSIQRYKKLNYDLNSIIDKRVFNHRPSKITKKRLKKKLEN